MRKVAADSLRPMVLREILAERREFIVGDFAAFQGAEFAFVDVF